MGGVFEASPGAIVGREVTNSYWDKESSEIATSRYGVEGLTTEAFGDEASFESWDFDTIWVIGTAPDGEARPVLQWQVE